MIADLGKVISNFQSRWQELHKSPRYENIVGRPYNPVMDAPVVPALIETYGDIIVYPSPSFPGWWDVKDTSGIIVSFAGEFGHRNAVQFAKNWRQA